VVNGSDQIRNRYACTNHVLGNGCGNTRSVDRKALEATY
jgi:hypothetical protein